MSSPPSHAPDTVPRLHGPGPAELAALITRWIPRVVTAAVIAPVVCIAAGYFLYFDSPSGTLPWTSIAALTIVCALVVGGAACVVLGLRLLRSRLLQLPRVEPPAPLVDDQAENRDHGVAAQGDLLMLQATRLQAFIARAINGVDELERTEDPELLESLYKIDQLLGLARRQAENLAVLGGGSIQQRNSPVMSIFEIVRAAAAETDLYERIMIMKVVDGHVHGHVAAVVIHLLAELLENATKFTPPEARKVEVHVTHAKTGLVVDITDRGLGIPDERLQAINEFLSSPADAATIRAMVAERKIGLVVVKRLADMHGVRVLLSSNQFGGIGTSIVLRSELLATPEPRSPRRSPRPYPSDTQEPVDASPARLPEIPRRSVHGGRHAVVPALGDGTPPPSRQQFQPPAGTTAAPLPRRQPAVSPAATDETPTVSGQLDLTSGHAPPPLPRREHSYLHPQLRQHAEPITPIPGANPTLMADLRRGQQASEADLAAASGEYPAFTPETTNEGQPS